MAENKFIAQLKGNTAPGSVLEIQDKGSKTSFANMPSGTSDAIVTYSDKRNNATAVLKGAMNWKVNGNTLSVANPAGDGSDYTGQTDVSGISDQQGNNLWINASYTVPADGLFLTKNTKWVLKLCGDNLIVNGGDTAEFTVLITAGNSTNITKKFFVAEQANQFCKELIIDFAESNTSTVKLEQGDTITLKLLSDIPNASARIYQGMTTLTLLQRAVDAENVISKDGSYEDVWEEINKKVNIDGSSTMTGPLKMRASVSFQCAIAPYWDGVGFYKLNDNDSVTLLASMEATDGFSPYASNTYNLGSSAHKWKNLYLGGKAYVSTLNNGADISIPTTSGTMALTSDIPDISNLANKDLSNLTSTGANIGNWSSNVTNCITEIPQDINLTLSSAGQLRLLAGSKLYVPNGDGVFTEKTITSDVTRAAGISVQSVEVALYNKADLTFAQLFEVYPGKVCSGTTDSLAGQAQHLWYDTTNNLIKYYGNDGVTNNYYAAFPLGLVSGNGSQITSIDQVFNGFGYIGSTVFALPGVKGLIPNGRNTDGTLNNTNLTTGSILTVTVGTGTSTDTLRIANSVLQRGFINYNSEFNYNYVNTFSSENIRSVAVIGSVSYVSGKITSLKTKTPFHSVDYSDTEYIANQAMPSGRYIDLTLGASGTNYTAPADGYICLVKNANDTERITIRNLTTNFESSSYASNNQNLGVFLPVCKGDSFSVIYSATGSTQYFRFIYANGSK